MSYMQNVEPLFNSEWITKMCADIDSGHHQSLEIKQSLLNAIKNSSDLRIPSRIYDPYRKAYEFVKSDIKKSRILMNLEKNCQFLNELLINTDLDNPEVKGHNKKIFRLMDEINFVRRHIA